MSAPPRPAKRLLRVTTILGVIAAAAFGVYQLIPPYALDPFCTCDLTYRLNATIDVDGRQYSSEREIVCEAKASICFLRPFLAASR